MRYEKHMLQNLDVVILLFASQLTNNVLQEVIMNLTEIKYITQIIGSILHPSSDIWFS